MILKFKLYDLLTIKNVNINEITAASSPCNNLDSTLINLVFLILNQISNSQNDTYLTLDTTTYSVANEIYSTSSNFKYL